MNPGFKFSWKTMRLERVSKEGLMNRQRPPRATPLAVEHYSRERLRGAIRPHNMDSMPITNEQREVVGALVLSIFTDMSNSGATLVETLSAIYMTGVENTISTLSREQQPAA